MKPETLNTTDNRKAVIYCRISSEAQAKKGDGLRSQETRCREYCGYKGYAVDRVFYDRAMSGSLIDRPGIKELMQFLKRCKTADQYVVVFDDISRLARDIRAYLDLRDAILSSGAEMDCPTIDFRQDSDGIYFENMQALNAQHYRQKNAEQTKSRMRARAMNGYWCFHAPPGYKFQKVAGHGNLLVRDEPMASILQEALEGFASGRLESQGEVKRFLESQPDYTRRKKNGEVRYEDVIRILTRPHYAGYIEIPDWGISLRKGHHEGLISFEAYTKIQERIEGGYKAPARKDINQDFPLRGFVTCGDCGKPLTGYFATSKTGKKHAYYMCFNKTCVSCRKSIRRDTVEGALADLIKQMVPSQNAVRIARAMFKAAWETRLVQSKELMSTLRQDIKRIDKQIDQMLDRIVDTSSTTTITAYERRIAKLERDKAIACEKLEKGPGPRHGFEDMFELALKFLSNPWKL